VQRNERNGKRLREEDKITLVISDRGKSWVIKRYKINYFLPP
jgi:hypothetical protein